MCLDPTPASDPGLPDDLSRDATMPARQDEEELGFGLQREDGLGQLRSVKGDMNVTCLGERITVSL